MISPSVFRFGFGFAAFLLWAWAQGAAAAMAQDQAPAITSELLKSVVGIRATVPIDSASRSWGPVREGSGIVIDSSGLVVTVRYLIRQATKAEIVTQDGEVVPAKIIAYDRASNLGLLRAERPLQVPPMRLGDSAALNDSSRVLAVSHKVGLPAVAPAQIVARFDYAAPSEYMIEQGILTVPAQESFGGAALVGENGRLVGIGSLLLQTEGAQAIIPTTLWIPINNLKPILADLIEHGRSRAPQHPWLGIRTQDSDGHVMVIGVEKGGPGSQAGLHPGDVILGVNGRRVDTMLDYYRQSWAQGDAGTVIRLDVLRLQRDDVGIDRIDVKSAEFDERRRPGDEL